LRQAEAEVNVSIDFFYDNIGSDGSWVEVADYGYCWQPSIAVSNSSGGRTRRLLGYTDVGWTWVSYEDFRMGDLSLRADAFCAIEAGSGCPVGNGTGLGFLAHGCDYVGWAPLPPRGRDEDYDNARLTPGGRGIRYRSFLYNFVDCGNRRAV